MALSQLRLLAASLVLLLLSCKKSEPTRHRTEPWLANPSASATTASASRVYRFGSDSRIAFALSGRKGKIEGHVPLARGELQLDPRELKQTRASFDVDLTKLNVDTAPPEGVGSATELALAWLELGPGVPAERRAPFATARFELVSLENLVPAYLDLSAKQGVVRATAVGTLLIHGFRAPVRVEVGLRAAGPEQVSIRSVSALVVALAPHDITARDSSGVVDALGATRAADWVGKTVRVEFELVGQSVK
jgi:hypothetical protein